ncbi:MAG: mechanosensitive ion channel family protein, partial [Cyanobacteria bacterium P01_H01_bin.121]
LGVIFLMNLLDRSADLAIDRFLRAWAENEFLAMGDLQRKSLRYATVLRSLQGLTSVIFSVIGFLWCLDILGVSLLPLLTGGAIIGSAIALIFQDFIRDFAQGCLILWEDQYAIGDVAVIGGVGGFVENMNLRVTQLRNSEGQLITIPNGSIKQVQNLTRTWSRVDFTIEIAYEADVQKALHILADLGQKLYEEPEWHEKLLDPPTLLGIDKVAHDGILIRVWIRTEPLQQWAVGREFRLRVRLALAEHDIEIGRPQRLVWTQGANGLPHPDYPPDATEQPAGPWPMTTLSRQGLPDPGDS